LLLEIECRIQPIFGHFEKRIALRIEEEKKTDATLTKIAETVVNQAEAA
jgi:hypothetical protein